MHSYSLLFFGVPPMSKLKLVTTLAKHAQAQNIMSASLALKIEGKQTLRIQLVGCAIVQNKQTKTVQACARTQTK